MTPVETLCTPGAPPKGGAGSKSSYELWMPGLLASALNRGAAK
jgi:hypothetical protein